MKLYAIFIIFTLLISCAQSPGTDDAVDEMPFNENEFRNFVATDTLSIELDSITAPEQYYTKLIEADSDIYYTFFNENAYALQGYSLNTNDLCLKINNKKKGPNALTNPYRFYFHNFDSIFFINCDAAVIQIFDSTGTKFYDETISFKDTLREYAPTLDNFYEFTYNRETKTIGFWIHPLSPSYENHKYWEGSRSVNYSIKKQRVLNTFGQFPKSYYYNNGIYEGFEYINSYAIPGYRVLYFHNSSEIQIYDHKGIIKRKLKVPEELDGDFGPPIMKVGQGRPSFERIQQHMTESNYCARMFSNPSGTLHYRVVKLPVSYYLPNNKTRNFHDRPFKIIILDENFKVISYKEFKGNHYDFYQSFAVNNKFYISMNNPLNSFSDENRLLFQVFEVGK